MFIIAIGFVIAIVILVIAIAAKPLLLNIGGGDITMSSAREEESSIAICREPIRSMVAHLIAQPVPKTITRFSEIPFKSQYQSLKYPPRSIHVGQLKLFLSEVQFLTECLPSIEKSSQIYVVYAGSGPGHTRKMLANMFPAIKFILIDPQEHDIRGSSPTDSLYFRLSNEVEFRSREVPVAHHDHGSIVISKRAKILPLSQEEKLSPDEIARMIIAEKSFTFYIIEDLFTDELATAFKLQLPRDATILFISDIRTNLTLPPDSHSRFANEDEDSPSDLDILLNNAWQHIWIHIMQPAFSMLKFRTPYMNPRDLRVISENKKNPLTTSTVKAYKERFDVDMLEQYENGHYYFVANDHINLQSFAGQSSSEVRLIVTRENLSRGLVEYIVKEHEDRLFSYNLMRDVCFVQRNESLFGRVPGLDGCLDCDLAIHILSQYCDLHMRSTATMTPVMLLQEVLTMIGRSISIQFHGKMRTPFVSIEDLCRDIIARESHTHAHRALFPGDTHRARRERAKK